MWTFESIILGQHVLSINSIPVYSAVQLVSQWNEEQYVSDLWADQKRKTRVARDDAFEDWFGRSWPKWLRIQQGEGMESPMNNEEEEKVALCTIYGEERP